MPTISTVGPGRDFETLAEWETWAGSQETADQIAECYAGADLGGCTVQSWSSTVDADNYPIIRAAAGQRHNGISGGAYVEGEIVCLVAKLKVDGIHFIDASSGCSNIFGTSIIWERCLLTGNSTLQLDLGSGAEVIARNCIVDCSHASGAILIDGSDDAGEPLIENCTCRCSNNAKPAIWTQNLQSGSVVTVKNCIGIHSGTNAGFDLTGGGGITITAANNLSDDSTADNFGGTGHVVNAVPADVFTDPDNGDLSLKAGSAGIDAGATLGAVTIDILGTARPQGEAYDIGAFEYVAIEVASQADPARNLMLLGIG